LKERILKLDNLETDLKDGVLLINLLEIISSRSGHCQGESRRRHPRMDCYPEKDLHSLGQHFLEGTHPQA